jgi:RimJ/RimL family protein N-acetyltransferase
MSDPVRLVAATPQHFEAFARSPEALAELLGSSSLPAGWPEFPEAFDFTAKRLAEHPEESSWWMQFFMDAATGELLGSGGFTGPPADRQVEMGPNPSTGVLASLGFERDGEDTDPDQGVVWRWRLARSAPTAPPAPRA